MDITTDSLREIYCLRLKFKEINAFIYTHSHNTPFNTTSFKCNFYSHFFFFWQLQFRKVYIIQYCNIQTLAPINEKTDESSFLQHLRSDTVPWFEYFSTDIHAYDNLFIQTRFLSNKASVYLKKKRLCLFHANKTELNDSLNWHNLNSGIIAHITLKILSLTCVSAGVKRYV